MQPLIITAACGQPDTTANVIESVVQAWRAGAAVAQIRAPSTHDPISGRPQTDIKVWTELIRGIRERCDILIHAGTAAMQVERRIEMLEALHPDTASFLLGHHALAVRGVERNSLRSRADALRLLQAHLATGVKAEFEVFHSGSIRNLEYLLGQVALPQPLALTLFFGWEGGDWSPPDVEEMLHRVRLLPEKSLYSITVAGPEQVLLQALAIARGGHVRAGPGDYGFYREGIPWRDSAQFVERARRLADEFGREVATPAMAAEILGIRRG
jgi:3-keto-5-aminohexanoate cleavage enzyme